MLKPDPHEGPLEGLITFHTWSTQWPGHADQTSNSPEREHGHLFTADRKTEAEQATDWETCSGSLFGLCRPLCLKRPSAIHAPEVWQLQCRLEGGFWFQLFKGWDFALMVTPSQGSLHLIKLRRAGTANV